MKKSGNYFFRTLCVCFGLFRVIVYRGMADLMFISFFDWNTSLTWFRYVLAVVFMLYGVYRCYRQVTGVDYYRNRRDDDEED